MSDPASNKVKFTPDEIESQLERILISPKFLAADQLSRFLRFIVEESLAGRQEQIKQYTIAVRALGRFPDFDPQIDAIVRMQARQLRRSLHRYYETDGANDPIRISIPKGRYVPLFQSNQAADQGAGTRSAQIDSIPTVDDPALRLPDGPSIAVLPFAYLGSDQEEAHFATGLTEEIIIALTRFQDFLVIGPLNRDRIWKQHLGPRGIGQEYKVRFVLDGTVRRRGQTLRLTARLADTVSGRELWGESLQFDLATASMLEIENDVVGQVVGAIADNYGVIPRALAKEVIERPTDRLSDYEAILRFHRHVRVLSELSQVEAMTALEDLLKRDPNHALAAALLGDLVASTYYLGYSDSTSVLDEAEELGRHALALDRNCQPAHYTTAVVHFLRTQQATCLDSIEEVLRLNPNNAHYIAAISLMLCPLGQWARGQILMQKAIRLNPHYPGWHHLVPFLSHYHARDYDAALIEAKRFNSPDYFWDPLIRAAALGQLGRKPEADKAVAELLALVPNFRPRAQSLIQRVVFYEQNSELLLDGLRKAGLDLKRSSV